MTLLRRSYQPEDFWRIRNFLREVYLLDQRREWCWQAYRFDYWRWHAAENIEHRKGLGKAVMTEGLSRLQRLGATQATIGSYSAHAGALYASMGFIEYDLSECWMKSL